MTKEKERTYKGIASFDSGKGNTMEITFPKVRPALKFIANLRRLDSYKGEFGFDWMRDDYQTICKNYEKLKKEYTLTKIYDKDYFVPWLSMFPQQEDIKLKLEIEILEGTATDVDIIKLPKKDGIRFEPEQIKVNEVENKQIKIICNSPLSNDVMIDLLDKNDEKVGAISVVKNANHEQLHFNIIPVRVLRSISKQTDIDIIEKQIDIEGTITKNGVKEKVKGWGDKGSDLTTDFKNLENYLNENSLNQALLQCTIGKIYDIIIDEDKWIEDNLIIDEGCVFKDDVVLDKFYEEFEKQHPNEAKKRGLIVFLSPIKQEKAGGEADLYDVDAKHCVIYNSNLRDKTSFAHELSHVMGLQHNFYKANEKNNADLIKKYEEKYIQPRKKNVSILKDNIEIYEGNIFKQKKTITNNNKILNDSSYSTYFNQNPRKKQEFINAINKSKKSISEQKGKITKTKERIIKTEQKIADLELSKRVYIDNKHKFNQGQTENIMDYGGKRLSLYKWQWKIMNNEIIKYYNKK